MAKLCILQAVLCVTLCTAQVTIPEEIRQEILAHQDEVDAIVSYIQQGPGYHGFYDDLTIFSDDHGPRFTGTEGLEEAINWTMSALIAEGFDNVHGESFVYDKWVRGDAHGAILQPRALPLDILALGSSDGTPSTGITAQVIVVKDFDELDARAAEVPGKIVVYNQEWRGYGYSNDYRKNGASRAAVHGAVAVLVRSVTSHSIYSIHTGQQVYDPASPRIPAACITVEDAELLQRLHTRGQTIEIFMNMSCSNVGQSTTQNVVADYTGTEYPNEFVIIGGHIDTWDVGYGPMDDGGGVIMAWRVLSNLVALGLRPKRTIRTVFWSAEEIGVVGGYEYFNVHKEENSSISIIMESDSGIFTPKGIGFTGVDSARVIMDEILGLLAAINATGVGPDGDQADISDWLAIGVPGGNLWNQENNYFDFHHSFGDAMTMENPDDLDLCSIVWTAVTYVLADLEGMLPRSDPSTSDRAWEKVERPYPEDFVDMSRYRYSNVVAATGTGAKMTMDCVILSMFVSLVWLIN